MGGYMVQDAHKTLEWLKGEWGKISKEEHLEKAEEAQDKKVKDEERYCDEQLIRIRKDVEDRLTDYAKILADPSIPGPLKNKKILDVLTLMEERVKQYHYFLTRLETARKAEVNVAKLETQTLEALKEKFDEIIRFKYHTP